MGNDARWVCNTCKTVCSRGGRLIFHETLCTMSVATIAQLKSEIHDLSHKVVIGDLDHIVGFLDDLQVWVRRHEGHNIHIGSDYSIDEMDLGGYHNELMNGKVSR